MKKKASILAIVLAIILAMPVFAVASEEEYIQLRQAAYELNAEVAWDSYSRTVTITCESGVSHTVVVEEVGGFIREGISWVPSSFATAGLVALLAQDAHDEVVSTDHWDPENFPNVRDARFSTDLPHGVISVNYIEYMSDNLGARSAFTYRELETAVWIVEELLAMGHSWDAIEVQEFDYWQVNELGLGLFPLDWFVVTSPMILGVGRDYQLRADRVSQNVILTIPGQSESTIIIGAHYDSPPYASASDNASGTALLLESAQRMMEIEHYHTLVYVFFGAEEVGLIGAYYYLEMLTQNQRDNIVLMVNADVLIEGPYIVYGAAALPELTAEFLEELPALFIDATMDMFVMQFEHIMTDFAAQGLDPQELLGFSELEEFIALVAEEVSAMPIDALIMQASLMGAIEPVVNATAAQVSALAAELTAANDFEIISAPEIAIFPTDSLAFIFDGHTVVNFVGFERMGNLTPELKAQLTRLGEGFQDFTVTILHSPLDEFHTIEYLWPGMMNANMHAFMLLLESILVSEFN